MRFGRQRRNIRVDLVGVSVASAVQTVQQREAEAYRSSQLRVRVDDDGLFRARVLVISRHHARPRLKGRLVADERGTELRGVICESYAEVIVPSIYGTLSIFLIGIGSIIVASGNLHGPGIFVCSGGAAVFALLAYFLGRLRPISFERDADELERAIDDMLCPADTSVIDHGVAP